jgi:SAM-dependent methyltransferase
MVTRSLDLGCGANPQNPYNAEMLYGIDIRSKDDSHFIHEADLAVDPIPFESDFFDAVTAYDFIEHIPRIIYAPKRRFAFVELMSEIYRVLKPGGLFFSRTPVFPNPELFRDPTHV